MLARQNLLKGADAEDGLRQKPIWRPEIIFWSLSQRCGGLSYLNVDFLMRLYMIVDFSYHFFMPIILEKEF